jgi:simple sugar transport system substrate-binding protein
MLRRTFLTISVAATALAASVTGALAEGKTFFWISHGGPADPVWTYFLQGAELWAADTGNTVNTSFFSGDVAAQQEAIRSAIAAGADGIVTTSPDPGSLVDVINEVNAAGIPVVNFNTPDAAVAFPAYVGNDLFVVGQRWAQYVVDNAGLTEGDFVWMPVEIPGASYGVEEERGIATVFEPLGITWEVTEATLDQAEAITRMTDYLTANGEKVDAIIGLGDLVTGSIQRVFDQNGIEPGSIMVVGWGNSLDTTQAVMDGYVNAAMWQDPQAQSYVALSLASMISSGVPVGFNVITGALYEADTAAIYHGIMGGN